MISRTKEATFETVIKNIKLTHIQYLDKTKTSTKKEEE